jgi:hypothetical protein
MRTNEKADFQRRIAAREWPEGIGWCPTWPS